jgi:predicted DCC family thiol-disulfide oxidoreductase YuxK
MAVSMASTKNSLSDFKEIALEFAHKSPGGLILMDAECVLCNRFAKFVIQQDRQGLFRFAPNRSELSNSVLDTLGVKRPLPETIVLIRGGKPYLFSDVTPHVFGDLGFPWSLAKAALIVPKPLRDFVYNLIAKNRYRLYGRTEACGLMSREDRARVLM